MTLFNVFIFLLIYMGIGGLLSFAVYDGGRHSIFLVFFYPLIIAFLSVLSIIVFVFSLFVND